MKARNKNFALPTELWHLKDNKGAALPSNSFALWYHQESNRGHKDFQSFALPTELWHQLFAFCECKVTRKLLITQLFLDFFEKVARISEKTCTFALAFQQYIEKAIGM